MLQLTMGVLSATSLGVADFVASQSSERIGAAAALSGMLFVSSLFLTIVLFWSGDFEGLFVAAHITSLLFACLHGAFMAVALLLFFYAMSVGKVTIVAPIIAAHPVIIILALAVQGVLLAITQLVAIAFVLLGIALVAASTSAAPSTSTGPSVSKNAKRYEPPLKVVLLAIISSVVYGLAIVLLQNATEALDDLQILWLGRCIGFVTAAIILVTREKATLPLSWGWILLFIGHGFLDSVGLLFILWGTDGGAGNAVVTVIASTFPIITVFLAWLILKERLGSLQLLGIAMVFVSVAMLVAS